MKFIKTKLPDVYLIQHQNHSDYRGDFTRLFCTKEIQNITSNFRFVQSNFCYTEKAHTFRGLHYQLSPHSEAKIVKCVHGAIIDIAIDMRPQSANYLKSIEIELNAHEATMIYIPEGFAHGYLSLQDNTKILYFTNNFYHPEAERGVNPLDPSINLTIKDKIEILSDKDRQAAYL